MLRLIVLLSLVALLNAADLNNETTKFTPIGSNLVTTNTTNNDNNNNSQPAIPSPLQPLSQSVSAQARKIEMTQQQLNAAGAVVTSMKTNNSGGNAIAANSTTMIVILVSLVLVTCVIAMIGTALFVMRRRFSIWRLNNSKLNLNEGGEEKSSTGSGSSSSSSGGVEGTEVVVNGGGGEEFVGGVGGDGETKEKTILNLTQTNVIVVEMVAETQGHLNEAAAVETTNEGRKKGSGKWDLAIILPKLFYFQSREFFSNLPSY